MGRDTSPEGDDSRNFCIIRATTTTANAPSHTNSWQRDVQRTAGDCSCTPRTRPLAPADTDADASLVCPPRRWRLVPVRHNSGKPRVAGPTPRFRRTLRRLASATPSRNPENFFSLSRALTAPLRACATMPMSTRAAVLCQAHDFCLASISARDHLRLALMPDGT